LKSEKENRGRIYSRKETAQSWSGQANIFALLFYHVILSPEISTRNFLEHKKCISNKYISTSENV